MVRVLSSLEVCYPSTLVISSSSVHEDTISMSSFFPHFLTSTPRKRSSSTDSVTLDSSTIDVDRISLISHDSTIPDEEKEDSSDLYMSVQASPAGSCEEEEEAYLTASSIVTGLNKRRTERPFHQSKSTSSPTSLFPEGPAWLDLQTEIVSDREQRVTGKTEDEDLFDLASFVGGVREELRWKQSLVADEKMRNLIAEFDPSYNPLEGPSTTTDYSDLVVRLKNAPAKTSVVIPSPIPGIDAMAIERTVKVPPHEIALRVLLNDHSTRYPRDQGTEDSLTKLIDFPNMLLVPSMSSNSPSCSTNRSVTTVSNGSKSDPLLGSIGGHMRVKDQWILDLHPTRTPQKILEGQGNRCADCGRVLEGEYAKRIRYCEYYGAVFCVCCSFTGKGVVPARILYSWNFRDFPLSDRAAVFLSKIYKKPVIRMIEASPLMMERMRSLRTIVALRPRLRHASTYVRYCAVAAKVLHKGTSLPDMYANLESHLIDEDDLFSFDDLKELRAGDLQVRLEGAFLVAREHVEKCRRPENELVSVCKDRAFTCWLCSSESDLIFSFQSDRAQRCEGCGSFAHMNCYRKAQKDNRGFEPECAKCKRMQESRIRRRFISTYED